MKPTSRPTTCGIDPSTVKLASVIKSGAQFHVVVRKLPKDRNLACLRAYEFAQGIIAEYGEHIQVYMEAPIMGIGGPGATIPQAQVGGAVMAGFMASGVAVTLCNNSTAKKRVCGRGNVKKDQVKEAMMGVWPELVYRADGDQDVIDAGMICLFGEHAIRLRAKIDKRFAQRGLT